MASTSQQRVPTAEDIEKYRNKFDTVVDPNLGTISIPDDFYNKWKTTFDKHKFGWIRGPNYKMVDVLYEKTNTGMILTNASSVSKCFGFVKPTRVGLSYVPAENRFWMRILPDNSSSSKRVPTAADIEKYKNKFETVIDPKLASISIPDDFYNKLKTSFDKHKCGWIRGANYKMVEVFYKKTNTGMFLTNASTVSKFFGFVKSTRVGFSYVPEENRFWMRILPDKSSSSKRVPTAADIEKYRNKFDTVIDPKLATISIPDEFYKKWKTSFDNHEFGWIRGPNYKNVEVSYQKTNTGMVLTNVSSVSRCFGFMKTTRVTLSYVPAENRFWMRILPENRSKRLMLNNKTIKHEEFTKKKPKLPSKGEQNHNRKRSSTRHFNGSIRVKATQAGYEWEKVVTEAMSRKIGTKVLHIPKKIARIVLKPKVTKILIQFQINGVTFISTTCNIMAAKRNKFERYISKEWCRIVKRTNLKEGDKLSFKLEKPPSTLIIELLNV
ncbi:unnamed protein product [Trifolium pratense]|uniref:Uncharacterized protein n=2 Tax=Trifolium pratense TaxID=57577 RepID=A0ACB0IQT2_TRIPR|nr:unnamed protein product [Trifolium pratense]CAJ2667115.1 unnamed protein product [Trifolium pratense]